MCGGESKVRCCKEQYCTGTWNVRSMNQGKLEVVIQEIAWVNIDIIGVSELKWIKMGELNSDDHYIYYCGQKSLRRNGVALVVNKRVQNAVLVCNLKNDQKSLVCSNHSISQKSKSTPQPLMLKKLMLYGLWWPTTLSRTNTQTRCTFHHRGLECKSRKSRDISSNSQVWHWSTKWSRAKANRVLPKNTLIIANTLFQQHERPLYTRTSPDGQNWNQIDYIYFCSISFIQAGWNSSWKQDCWMK